MRIECTIPNVRNDLYTSTSQFWFKPHKLKEHKLPKQCSTNTQSKDFFDYDSYQKVDSRPLACFLLISIYEALVVYKCGSFPIELPSFR